MIRLFFYLLVLLAGLAGAAIWFGQMHHLRQAAPGRLPVWTVPIDDAATLREGKAGLGSIQLTWQAQAPTAQGLVWLVDFTADGVAMRAELLVPYWPKSAVIRDGKGTVAQRVLTGGGSDALLRVADITGTVPILDARDGTRGEVVITFAEETEIDGGLRKALSALGEPMENGVRIKLPSL